MKGSIIIVSFFVVGVLLGRFVDIPNLLTAEEPTLYALYALMFLVGISIGSDKKALEAIYKEGAEKANYASMKLLRKMQKKIGLIPR